MDKEKKALVCIRCGKSAEESGVPSICKSCVREGTHLRKRLKSSYAWVLWIEGRSKDYILRYLEKEALKTLETIRKIREEIDRNGEV